MYLKLDNENYGYAVGTHGDYVLISNPETLRWTSETASLFRTGSLDVYRYNKSIDEHELIITLYKGMYDSELLLARETGSDILVRDPLHTELNNTGISENKDLEVDRNNYEGMIENGFGLSLDVYNKILVVGCPYYTQKIEISSIPQYLSGSSVDIFNLQLSETYPFTGSTFLTSIDNHESLITESFGKSVAVNSDWLAIGSPHSSDGKVFLYQKNPSSYAWTLYQTITSPLSNAMFGVSVKLNKQTGSYSGSLIVGCGNISASKAYYYEFINGTWTNTYTFNPTYDVLNLTFAQIPPYQPTMSIYNGFGASVSLYQDTVIIGEYLDRSLYEYSGSSFYNQGSVYIFEKCSNTANTSFNLVLKTYGNETILKNNRLGYYVDIYNNNAIAGCPKVYNNKLTSCFIKNTISQISPCSSDLEQSLNGQAMLLQKNTGSNQWEIVNIYQRKKRFLNTYSLYGNSVGIGDKSMVVGSPILLTDLNREIDLSITQSSGASLANISGKGYIYNLKNLKTNFQIGNVFYRNGKIVVMSSGSNALTNIFTNPNKDNPIEYDIKFKGKHTIHEKQIICTVNPGEFNTSTNPTATYKNNILFDINKNGKFDYEDLYTIMGYMKYKITIQLDGTYDSNWKTIVDGDDEESIINFYESDKSFNINHYNSNISQSINTWEFIDPTFQYNFDFNQDNKINTQDMSILWKYFIGKLTQKNYSEYITPECTRQSFGEVVSYLDQITGKNSPSYITPEFLLYESNTLNDRTGSYLSPYVTTIGCYNENLELLMVAKLSNPLKLKSDFPINFILKMDF